MKLGTKVPSSLSWTTRRRRTSLSIAQIMAKLGVSASFKSYAPNLIPNNRKKYTLHSTVRARLLTTIPDSTSRKFILLGTYPRGAKGQHAIIFLDFANEETGGSKIRQCDKDKDMEKWYARPQNGKECLMGHKVRTFSTRSGYFRSLARRSAAMVLPTKTRRRLLCG